MQANKAKKTPLENPERIMKYVFPFKMQFSPVRRRCCFTCLCAICILSIVTSVLYWYSCPLVAKSMSLYIKVISNQKDNLPMDHSEFDSCLSHVISSTASLTLNLTIPDWTEMLAGYIPLKQKKPGWTVYRLPRPQYYPKNQAPNNGRVNGKQSNMSTLDDQLLLAHVDTHLALWDPILCKPQGSTAIIIPYRNREQHLRALLRNLPAFLIYQNVRFTIFVIEQMADTRFNRALLLNIGFLESQRIGTFKCYIFHDVDLIPADIRVPYSCGSNPVHLAASMNKFGYRLPYPEFVGGVLAMTHDQFTAVHGFSNYYFGWGAEDDDMFHRIRQHNFSVVRPNITKYFMIRHGADKYNEVNKENVQLLKKSEKKVLNGDGYLQADYRVLTAEPRYKGLVYWIEVDIPEIKLVAQRNAIYTKT